MFSKNDTTKNIKHIGVYVENYVKQSKKRDLIFDDVAQAYSK